MPFSMPTSFVIPHRLMDRISDFPSIHDVKTFIKTQRSEHKRDRELVERQANVVLRDVDAAKRQPLVDGRFQDHIKRAEQLHADATLNAAKLGVKTSSLQAAEQQIKKAYAFHDEHIAFAQKLSALKGNHQAVVADDLRPALRQMKSQLDPAIYAGYKQDLKNSGNLSPGRAERLFGVLNQKLHLAKTSVRQQPEKPPTVPDGTNLKAYPQVHQEHHATLNHLETQKQRIGDQAPRALDLLASAEQAQHERYLAQRHHSIQELRGIAPDIAEHHAQLTQHMEWWNKPLPPLPTEAALPARRHLLSLKSLSALAARFPMPPKRPALLTGKLAQSQSWTPDRALSPISEASSAHTLSSGSKSLPEESMPATPRTDGLMPAHQELEEWSKNFQHQLSEEFGYLASVIA